MPRCEEDLVSDVHHLRYRIRRFPPEDLMTCPSPGAFPVGPVSAVHTARRPSIDTSNTTYGDAV